MCRELGIRLVDSLGEKVQSSLGTLVHDHACPYGIVLVDVGDFPTIDSRGILDMYEIMRDDESIEKRCPGFPIF